jgi:hypothetical protein
MIVKTGAEMLIETRSSLDKIEGFRNESFEPEEVELYLNKSQLRLLDDLINKNFQQGTLRYEWIRPFQAVTSPEVLVWAENQAVAAIPEEVYYLVAAKGTAVVDATDPDGSFDDGCITSPIDPDLITNAKSKVVQIRIQETGQALEKTGNSFYGNSVKIEPIAEALSDTLIIHRDNNFIVSNVSLDYISEPSPIDVTSTDEADIKWSPSAIQKIIDYTVEYMRLTIEDPGYQGNVNDFNTRTQNA